MKSPIQNRTRGAIWRKWDLHVHVPGTKMNNHYTALDNGRPDWDQFVDIIHNSDVEAIGITDYFSLKSFFKFKEQYTRKHPDDGKVFFPNLELRLNHAVHHKGAEVNIHLILPPTLTEQKAELLLSNLEMSNRDMSSNSGRHLKCSEIQDWGKDELAKASLSIDAIINGLIATFPVTRENIEEAAIIFVSGRDDGASPGKELSGIKEDAIDAIDISTHALFSRQKDSNYWLKKDRIKRESGSKPKPTFGGCDAHNFDELRKMLGKSGEDGNRKWELTWVKGDLSYDGLLQTLAEPEGRVRIQDSKPDSKDPFRVIDRIEFRDAHYFPKSIQFNPNLTAIIGSRSSGKSALLAHTAYAVDKRYTIEQQASANNKQPKENVQGPANSFSWQDVNELERKVVWADPNVKSGKIVYMPQNALFELGDKSESVTNLIRPLLKELHPSGNDILTEFARITGKLKNEIRSLVEDIFSTTSEISVFEEQLRQLGDKSAIEAQITQLTAQHDDAIKKSGLTESEQEKLKQINKIISQHTEIKNEADKMLKEWDMATDKQDCPINVNFSVQPEFGELPSELQKLLTPKIEALQQLSNNILNRIADNWEKQIKANKKNAEESTQQIENKNGTLLEKAANARSASNLKSKIESLDDILSDFKSLEDEKEKLQNRLKFCHGKLQQVLTKHDEVISDTVDRFNRNNFSVATGTVKVERGYPSETDSLIQKINLRTADKWIKNDGDHNKLDLRKTHDYSKDFIDSLLSQKTKVKKGEQALNVVFQIMTSLEEIRLYALYDEDRIGGFEPTSMTPGKRALFALTLLLDGQERKWPLLLDQPEDDLDSRSVFDTIVPFLKKVKKNRQIIMVTHDANLVIGADAEQVIVANRNGSDRQNADQNQLFDYFSGSLENSQDLDESDPRVLERQGIKEHCCEILDGGREAFQKRKEKYKF